MAAPAQAERVLLDGEALRRTIVRIAHEIVERNPDLERTALVGIHTRGVPFAQRLRREIEEFAEQEVALGTLDITFHRDDVHARDGSGPDWSALRAAGTTLVIYMGVKRAPAIVAAMLEAGFPADMPACAVQDGTLETQTQVVTTLAALPAAIAAARLDSPAVLVIGEVVALARAGSTTAERVAA